MLSTSAKASILCFFIEGSGHIWLGNLKRGLLILAGAIVVGGIAQAVLRYGLFIIPALAYKIWQLSDVSKFAAIRQAEQAPPVKPSL